MFSQVSELATQTIVKMSKENKVLIVPAWKDTQSKWHFHKSLCTVFGIWDISTSVIWITNSLILQVHHALWKFNALKHNECCPFSFCLTNFGFSLFLFSRIVRKSDEEGGERVCNIEGENPLPLADNRLSIHRQVVRMPCCKLWYSQGFPQHTWESGLFHLAGEISLINCWGENNGK